MDRETISAIANYKKDAMIDVSRISKNFHSLSQPYKDMLPSPYTQRIEKIIAGVEANHSFLKDLIGSDSNSPEDSFPCAYTRKVRSLLKESARDWGSPNIDISYALIIEQLNSALPDKGNVLIPGSGTGRLLYEIAKEGFNAKGLDSSYFMIRLSNFILQECKQRYTIYPFVHDFLNVVNIDDVFSPVTIPEMAVSSQMYSIDFGEFSELYKHSCEEWDCVVTNFYVDTTPDIFECIETIHNCLKHGKYWINFGPLLYQYTETNPTFQLSWEEFRTVVGKVGFEIIQEESKSYTYESSANPLLRMEYECLFFTAKKIDSSIEDS